MCECIHLYAKHCIYLVNNNTIGCCAPIMQKMNKAKGDKRMYFSKYECNAEISEINQRTLKVASVLYKSATVIFVLMVQNI